LIFQEKKKFVYECISKEYSAAVVVVVLDYIVSKRKVREKETETTQKKMFEDRIINSYASIHIHTGFVCKKKKEPRRNKNEEFKYFYFDQ